MLDPGVNIALGVCRCVCGCVCATVFKGSRIAQIERASFSNQDINVSEHKRRNTARSTSRLL